MRNKISIALAIVTILTASALTLSNQAFAQLIPGGTSGQAIAELARSVGQTLAGQDHVPHVGQVLGGTTTGLGKFVLPSGGNPVTHPGLGQQGSHPGLGASQCPNLSPANQQTPSGTVGRCTSYYP